MTDQGDHCSAAQSHLDAKAGGHWWDVQGAEPPEWYTEQLHSGTVVEDAPQRCESVPTPDVPDPVPWEQYQYYSCDGCGWPCLEHEESEASAAGTCWYCYWDGSLPDGRTLVKTPDRATESNG